MENVGYEKWRSNYHNEVDYKVGDDVSHPKFGNGTIIYLTKDLMTVVFKGSSGERILMKKHKVIKKLLWD